MMGLTPVQSRTLEFIKAEAVAKRPAPSYDQIAKHLGLKSRGRVCEIMNGPEERGAIRRLRGGTKHKARAFEVVDRTVRIRPDLWDALVHLTNLESVSAETLVNQFIRDGLENA